MDRTDILKLRKLWKKLSDEYGLTVDEIKEIVNSPYKFTHSKVVHFNLKDINEQEFNALKKVFMYKGFGKIYLSYALINRRNKQRENRIKLNEIKWKKK